MIVYMKLMLKYRLYATMSIILKCTLHPSIIKSLCRHSSVLSSLCCVVDCSSVLLTTVNNGINKVLMSDISYSYCILNVT